MEQGKLRLFVSKSGLRSAEIITGDNRRLPVHHFEFGEKPDGEFEVSFEKKTGDRQKQECNYHIEFADEKPRKETTASRGGNTPLPEQVDHVRIAAKAPYNFVPLNNAEELFQVPVPPDFDRYHCRSLPPEESADKPEYHNTGWIDLDIKTRTPLYIRDTLTTDERNNADRARSTREKYDNPDFFSPGGKPRIPGSTLRGMTRQMVEIIGFGKFGFYTDRTLYYRAMADKSGLRKEYKERMTSSDSSRKPAVYRCSAGDIVKRGNAYYLRKSPEPPKQIFNKEARQLVAGKGKKYADFEYYDLGTEYLVVSGPMLNKRRDWKITKPGENAEEVKLDPRDVESYLNDETRNEKVPNLIADADKAAREGGAGERGMPCFYVTWKVSSGEERVSFGNTGMFRLAYEKSIGDHIPEHLKSSVAESKKALSLAEAIFGTIIERDTWGPAAARTDEAVAIAGRVFVEDAFPVEEQNDYCEDEGTPRVLSAPKPTTFQHYLVQTSDNAMNLSHYNSHTCIRGNKLYWHQSGKNWRETNEAGIEASKSQYTRIKPVKSDLLFKGRIRFENLSDVELGALLFSLRLPDGCCHKLGMGKPLGLGSVQIQPTLYLSNRETRYHSLFTEWDNRVTASAALNAKIRAFEKAVLAAFGKPVEGSLWETSRLKEVLVMLHVETGKALEQRETIRYMTIQGNNEFGNRNVLPTPSRVADDMPQPSATFTEFERHIEAKSPTGGRENAGSVDMEGD